jgi:hypothetical protein
MVKLQAIERVVRLLYLVMDQLLLLELHIMMTVRDKQEFFNILRVHGHN